MSEPLLAPVLGWHFVGQTLRGGRPIPVDGEMLMQNGPIIPCKNGLHASVKVLDALQFAPGTTLCRVQLSGTAVEQGGTKHAASARVIQAVADINHALKEQGLAAREIAQNAEQVAQMTEQGSLASGQASGVAVDVLQRSGELKRLADMFKL